MKTFNDLVHFEEPKVEKRKDTGRFHIAKMDDDKRLAFGWANITLSEDGEELVDWQMDMIDPEDLENAAYNYVIFYRGGGEMHKEEIKDRAILVESMVFTPEKCKALGIPDGTLPTGWWIGFYVKDDDLWEKVRDGTYSMFSIQGEAHRVEVKDPDEPADEPEK